MWEEVEVGDPVKHLALLRAIREYEMPPHEKAIMLSLCLYGDEDGKDIRPSQTTIARLHHIHRRWVVEIFATLKEKGYLIEDGWHNRRRKWRINTELFFDALQPKKAAKKVEKPKPPVVPPPTDGMKPPPLSPEEIARRHADKEKLLEKLRR